MTEITKNFDYNIVNDDNLNEMNGKKNCQIEILDETYKDNSDSI